MYKEVIREYSDLMGIKINFRVDAEGKWQEVLKLSSYIPVLYTSNSLDFQLANESSHVDLCEDLAMVISWNNKPAAVWPLSISTGNNLPKLSSHGLPILTPLFTADCPELTKKKISKLCLDLLDLLAKKFNVKNFESLESFNSSIGYSSWHLEAMARGASYSVGHDLFINLQSSIETIKGGLRKSYKSLISSGIKKWDIEVLSSPDKIIWEEFKVLHHSVSGRQTRSEDTWRIHFDDIQNENGFLVHVRSKKGDMVGGGFFNFSRDEGFYAVGAYNRDLLSQPLGHLVQFQAIIELKKRNIIWHRLGVRGYEFDVPTPSRKEISIGEFKQGFASHVFPRHMLKHSLV